MTWWNGNWKYRQEVKITNNAGKYLYGHQVLVTLTNSNFDFQHANTHGKDFRAISPDGSTSYPYYIEKWDWGQEAKVWVRIPIIAPGEETTFFIYYGNPDAFDESSGIAFEFFDDFDGTSLDEEKWEKGTDVTESDYSVSDSILDFSGGGTDFEFLKSKSFSSEPPVILRVKQRDYTSYTYPAELGFGYRNYGGVQGAPADDCVLKAVSTSDKYHLLTRASGSESSGNSLSSDNEYHIFEIIWTDSKVSLRKDGTEISYTTTNIPTSALFVAIGHPETAAPNSWKGSWDWILVRKYADPEPVTELGRVDSLIINYEFPFEVECEATHSGKYTYLIKDKNDIFSLVSSVTKNSFGGEVEVDLWFTSASYPVQAPPFPFQCANAVYVRNDSDETLYDVPVLLHLVPQRFDYGCCASDGNNLKFVSSDYSENLPFWIEEWNYGGNSKVWVKLPEVPPGTNVCAYLVYGFHDVNEMQPQEPEKIFLFFDGFEDGDLSDWSKKTYDIDDCYWWIKLTSEKHTGDYGVHFFILHGCYYHYPMISIRKTISLPPGEKVLRLWRKSKNSVYSTHHWIMINGRTVHNEYVNEDNVWRLISTPVFEDSGNVTIEIVVDKNRNEDLNAYVDDIRIERVVNATFEAWLGDKICQAPLFAILPVNYDYISALKTQDTWIEGFQFTFPSSCAPSLLSGIQKLNNFPQEIVTCYSYTSPLRFPYSWTRRRAITINNETGEDIEDCQVCLELNPSNFDYSHCNIDGSDIRFVNVDFSKTLPFFIQEWEYNGTSKIWIKVDKIPQGSNVCAYIYYDNPCISTSASDALKVFKRILPVRYWFSFEEFYTTTHNDEEVIWTKNTFEGEPDLILWYWGEDELTINDISVNTPWGKGVHMPENAKWQLSLGYYNPKYVDSPDTSSLAIKVKLDPDNPDQNGGFTGGGGWGFGLSNGKLYSSRHKAFGDTDTWSDIDTLTPGEWEDIVITDNGKYRAYFKNGQIRDTHKNTTENTGNHDWEVGNGLSGSYDEVVWFERPLLADEVKDYHDYKGIALSGEKYKFKMFLRKNVDPLPTCSLGNEELATPLWDIVIQHSEDLKFNTTHLLGETLNVLYETLGTLSAHSQLPTLDEEADFLVYDMITGIVNRDDVPIEFGDVFIQKRLWVFALLEEYPELATTFFNSFEETIPVSPNISITKPVHWTIRGAEVPDLISYKVTQEWAAPDTAELRFRGVPQFLMGDYIHIVYETGNPSYPEVTLFKGPVLTIDRELVKGREETVVRAVSNEWYLTKQNCFWGDESVLYGLDPGFTTRSLLSMWLGDWTRCGSGYGCLCTWVTIPGIFEGICKKLREKYGWEEDKRWDPWYASIEEWWSIFNGSYVGKYWDKTTGVAPYYFENVPEWQTKYVENAGKSGFNFFYGTSKWDGIMQICNVCDCVFYCIYSDSNTHFPGWEDTNYPPYTGGDGKRLAIFLTRDSCENQTLIYRPSNHPPKHSFQSGFESSEFFNPLAREFALKIDDDPDHGEYIKKLIGIREREEQSSEETKINRLAVTCQDFPIVTAEVDTGGKPVEEYIAINNVDVNDLADLEAFAKERLQELRTPNVTFEARFLDLVLYKFRFNWEDVYIPIHTGAYIGLEGIEGLPPSSDEDGYYRIMKITYEMGEQTGGKLLTTLECRDTDLIHPGSPKLNEIENIMHREAKKIEKGPILPGHPCPSNPRPPMLGEIPWIEIGEIVAYHPEDNTVDVKITKTGQIVKGVPLI